MATTPNQPVDSGIHHLPKKPIASPIQRSVEPQPVIQRKPAKSTESPTAPPLTAQQAALRLMRKPFESHQISTMCKPTKKDNAPGRCGDCGGWHKLPAVELSYVGHAALTDRLLDADPEWTWEPLAYAPNGTPLLDEQGGMWIKLTVGGVTRLGYGDAQGKIGGDATKERIGDALRNAAMRFGAALDLWHKGTLHLVETSDEEKNEAQPALTPQYPPRRPTAPDTPSQPVGGLAPFQKTGILNACKKSGKTSQDLTEYLRNTFGYDALDEMPKKDFTQTLKWAMEA